MTEFRLGSGVYWLLAGMGVFQFGLALLPATHSSYTHLVGGLLFAVSTIGLINERSLLLKDAGEEARRKLSRFWLPIYWLIAELGVVVLFVRGLELVVDVFVEWVVMGTVTFPDLATILSSLKVPFGIALVMMGIVGWCLHGWLIGRAGSNIFVQNVPSTIQRHGGLLPRISPEESLGDVKVATDAREPSVSTSPRVEVRGSTQGGFVNNPVIAVYWNDTLVGTVEHFGRFEFEINEPGEIMFKYLFRSRKLRLEPSQPVIQLQLSWDRIWGRLLVEKMADR